MTASMGGTRDGVILGTAAYMSPEQARGQTLDKRTDIWSFGCVLYEMLTGRTAFGGETLSDTIASVIEREPEWAALPAALPAVFAHSLRRCVRKNPRQRVHDVADVRLAMEDVSDAIVSVPSEQIAAPSLPVWQRPVTIAASVLAALVVGGGAVWTLSRPAPPRVARFPIPLAADQAFSDADRPLVVISPDGTQVVYVADGSLWLRPVDQLQAVEVRGTEEGGSGPFFSADGHSIGFHSDGQLKKVAVSGGATVTLAGAPRAPYGASWGVDDMILYGQPEGIMQVPGEGGTAELLIPVDDGKLMYGPQMLPGGEWVLLTLGAGQGAWDEAQIVAQSVTTGERTVLVDGGRDGRYLPTGHLVYLVDHVLFAVPFDVDSRQVSGGPVPLVEGVREADVGTDPARGGAQFSVSTNGSLAYVPGGAGRTAARELVWVSRNGDEELLAAPPRDYRYVSVSPDGRRAAVEIVSNGGTDVWVAELSRGTLTRITTDPGEDTNPLWSPDGQRLLFVSERSGQFQLLWKSADGTGDVEVLTSFEQDVFDVRPYSWTPDGTAVAVPPATPGTGADIGMVLADGTGEWEPLIQTPIPEYQPAISPNGRWLAYLSVGAGQSGVYVDRFPTLGNRQPVDGGRLPTWSPDGRELIYVRGGTPSMSMMRVTIEEADGNPASLRVGQPELILEHSYFDGARRSYDLAPDGERFLMIKSDPENEEAGADQINVVLNWAEELKARVPAP